MHQNAFGGWALPGPAVGAYSAPLDPLAELRGDGRRESENGEGEGKGRGKNERAGPPTVFEVH